MVLQDYNKILYHELEDLSRKIATLKHQKEEVRRKIETNLDQLDVMYTTASGRDNLHMEGVSDTRICATCRQEKDVEDFYRCGVGRHSDCRKCMNLKSLKYRKAKRYETSKTSK